LGLKDLKAQKLMEMRRDLPLVGLEGLDGLDGPGLMVGVGKPLALPLLGAEGFEGPDGKELEDGTEFDGDTTGIELVGLALTGLLVGITNGGIVIVGI
jgi:hypothetical protein